MSWCQDGSIQQLANNTWAIMLEQWLVAFHSYYSPLHVLLTLPICLFGLCANVLHLRIVTCRRLREQSVNVLLAAIAVCDLGTCAAYLFYLIAFRMVTQPSQCDYFEHTNTWLYSAISKTQSILCIWLHSASLWLSVAMALFRYMTMRKVRQRGDGFWTSAHNAYVCSAGVFAVNLLLTSPFAAVITIEEMAASQYKNMCESRGVNLTVSVFYRATFSKFAVRDHCKMLKANQWLSGLSQKVLPCVGLTVLMLMLVCKLLQISAQRSRSAVATAGSSYRSSSTNTILVVIVIVCLGTELPQGIFSIIAAKYTDYNYSIYRLYTELTDLLSLINMTSNFILCVMLSKAYRTVFFTLIIQPLLDKLHLKASTAQQRELYRRSTTKQRHTTVRHTHRGTAAARPRPATLKQHRPAVRQPSSETQTEGGANESLFDVNGSVRSCSSGTAVGAKLSIMSSDERQQPLLPPPLANGTHQERPSSSDIML